MAPLARRTDYSGPAVYAGVMMSHRTRLKLLRLSYGGRGMRENYTTCREAIASELTELTTLGADWGWLGSVPVSSAVASHALWLMDSLDSFVRVGGVELGMAAPEIMPTQDGGVQIEWDSPHGNLEISVYPGEDGEIATSAFHGRTARFDAPGDCAALALWVMSHQRGADGGREGESEGV